MKKIIPILLVVFLFTGCGLTKDENVGCGDNEICADSVLSNCTENGNFLFKLKNGETATFKIAHKTSVACVSEISTENNKTMRCLMPETIKTKKDWYDLQDNKFILEEKNSTSNPCTGVLYMDLYSEGENYVQSEDLEDLIFNCKPSTFQGLGPKQEYTILGIKDEKCIVEMRFIDVEKYSGKKMTCEFPVKKAKNVKWMAMHIGLEYQNCTGELEEIFREMREKRTEN